jgi:hypothetical protein
MAAAPKDQFANYAILSLLESAANTLTFKKLETGISLNEKVAWVVNRIEYFINNLQAAMFNTDGDTYSYGLSVSGAFATAALTETTVIDFNQVCRLDFGTVASALMVQKPITKDFSQMPGGGILVPPTPLYLFGVGYGLAAAQALTARIHYTLLSLSVDQYWELVEARRVLSS